MPKSPESKDDKSVEVSIKANQSSSGTKTAAKKTAVRPRTSTARTPAPTKTNGPVSDRKVVLIALAGIAAAIVVMAVVTMLLINSSKREYEEQLAVYQEQQAAKDAARIAAELARQEELAKQPPVQPSFTMRREPPTIVRVDEFTITTVDGETFLIGLPIIAGHGKEGVYLGSQPPASEIKFAHDSKWARGGLATGTWRKVQIANWDPDNRRYIPIPGIPMISRTLPDGSLSYQPWVWALVMPGS